MTASLQKIAKLGTLASLLASLLSPPSAAWAQGMLEVRNSNGERSNLPLTSEVLRISIDNQFSQTQLQHIYFNPAGGRLEGRFQLQAGENSHVESFAYWNGEQKIVGEVFEKQDAARIYNEVVSLGRDPGLLEQVGEGAFSFRVFPIEGGEKKRVEVSFDRWLVRRGNDIEYRMPLSRTGADIRITIDDERNIGAIVSKTHSLSVRRTGKHHATISATPIPGSAPGALLSLHYHVSDTPWRWNAALHKDPGHDGYLSLSIATPKQEGRQQKRLAKDVTLVLDHSGSMSGASLANAREAAAEIVRKLPIGDRINVVLFDDSQSALFAKPRELTEPVREETLAYIEAVNAAGGTDIAGALAYTFGAQLKDDHPNLVLFLTDGVSDSAAALAIAKSDSSDSRLYTVGLGDGVEKPFLSRLAKMKRGRFTFISDPNNIKTRMSQLYEQLDSPVLVNLQVSIEGVRTERVYPRTMPDLYANDELRVVARLRDTGRAQVVLRGLLDGKPVEYRQAFAVEAHSTKPWVGRVWAQTRVDDLLESIALGGKSDELKDEVINLAVAYNFVTPFTSFLALPAQENQGRTAVALKEARARKQKILAAHKDAVALSRSAMPPGDPVLQVKAPADAIQVTAYFPFGLTKDLEYSTQGESWKTRFLVPTSVVDGVYEVSVVIVLADHSVQMSRVPYTIDSTGPEFEVETDVRPDGIHITVVTAEEAREVTVSMGTLGSVRITLQADEESRRFVGIFPLSSLRKSGQSESLKIVVADVARNEGEKSVAIEVP